MMKTLLIRLAAIQILLWPVLTQAATFDELARGPETTRPAQPFPRQLATTPVYISPSGNLDFRTSTYAGGSPGYEGPPWVLEGTRGRPNRQFHEWSYGHLATIDNPYTWEYLDNRFLWARWGNPLAPWTSAEISDWWRRRSGMPYLYQPRRW